MSTYSYSGNDKTDKQDHVDRYLAAHINDLQDEVEIVEGVITGGTEGQVLTADANGKAGWEDASGGGGGFQPVTVSGDWSNFDTLWSDIQASTGMGVPPAGYYLSICLWEGPTDSDDYADCYIASNEKEYNLSFASPPTSGTAYIVGILRYQMIG
jgi:hypothetical protein